jgi:4-amino-4-deoxy-L-arabinose transferase-like glycosyltransferase
MWDSIDYDLIAKRILNGSFWKGEIFIIPPGYPLFIAFMYKIFNYKILPILIIQNMFTLITIIMLAIMTKRVFGKLISFTATFLYSLYGVSHFYDNKLIDNTLLTFLLIISVYCYVNNLIYKKSIIYLILSGLTLGYISLIKPNFILMFLAFLLLTIYNYRKEALRYAASIILSYLIIILPVSIRNYAVSGSPVLISAYSGLAFYAGNKQGAKPYFEGLPISTSVTSLYRVVSNYIQEETAVKMSPNEISNYYYKKALNYILHNPYNWIKLAFNKILLSLGNYEQEANYSYDLEENPFKKFFIIPYSIIIALAIMGLIVSEKNKMIAIIFIPVGVVYFTLAMLYMIPRLREPAIIFLSIFAGIFLDYIILRNISNRRRILLITFSAAILILSLNIKPPYPYDLRCNEYVQYGLAYMQIKNFNKAEYYFKKAIDVEPKYYKGYASLGLLYKNLNQDQKALENYKLALRYAQNDAETHNNIASIYFRNNNIEMAEKHLQKAYELNPYHASILYNMAILKLKLGNKQEAAYYYDRALRYGAIDNAKLYNYFVNNQ